MDVDKARELFEVLNGLLDMAPKGFIAYAMLVQIAPDRFHGFSGFISNPKALPSLAGSSDSTGSGGGGAGDTGLPPSVPVPGGGTYALGTFP